MDASTTVTPGSLVLLRHGQTVWSESGQYTGRTDITLTQEGCAQAEAAGERLRKMFPAGFEERDVFTSPLVRAQTTADLAGFPEHTVVPDLAEWDYGRAEGRTRAELSRHFGSNWDVWSDGPQTLPIHLGGERNEMMPDGTQVHIVNGEGELLDDAAKRAAHAIELARPAMLAGRNVLFVAHAHILRILATQFLGQQPQLARHLRLDTAHFCQLGFYKGDPVIEHWNI
ncbi:histidine phosphatase [Bifidobacterium dolichotidis]|uniref:phosphoglycerate mutase (2,3-diphosphoglycerate-dependent) n=1 Tax=Bifidobacterium dolichotidis TaxID=2306976 RepID=A0A430FKH8_9BIFI|nr:histidine phosphatase family protein [Bifidobacterium dolichotidis]RSX53403.1 histidine phosphatase [Bifidobacterium dolichotidis]